MASKLAVIGTFFRKYEESQRAIKAVLASTRLPDELWLVCERELDMLNAAEAVYQVYGDNGPPDSLKIFYEVCPTPINADGSYKIVPYSNKNNFALDRSKADAFVYLDNGSIPHPEKYETMLRRLDESPLYGAVYCSQHRTGFQETESWAVNVVYDAYCILNFTQVMHRKTTKRWSLDMTLATPADLVDAVFWRDLHAELGPFIPVAHSEILDEHHIPSPAANGM